MRYWTSIERSLQTYCLEASFISFGGFIHSVWRLSNMKHQTRMCQNGVSAEADCKAQRPIGVNFSKCHPLPQIIHLKGIKIIKKTLVLPFFSLSVPHSWYLRVSFPTAKSWNVPFDSFLCCKTSIIYIKFSSIYKANKTIES